ncbi:MAG TPA: CHAT domain-containing protein, partial [Pyrinomonadaceae bacterium]|nr:CHAT domain-containing protein [Pyrinomonadaceae bacterium]
SETLRSNVASNELRASYFASVHQQVEFYVAVLMEQAGRASGGGAAAAFEVSERGRARSLLETLAEARADIRRGADQLLLRREQALNRQLDARAAQRVQLLARKAPEQELTAAERALEALAKEYTQVQGQIRASSPRYAALVRPAPLSLAEIQQQVLDRDTVLLEYSLGEERSFVWAVTPSSIKSFTLPSRVEVEKAAVNVYRLLTERNRAIKGETAEQRSARVARAEAEYDEASTALSRMILGPLASELGSKRIAVVADGALQYVPFAALPDPAGARAGVASRRPPLIIGHEILSLPSASVLALMREELRRRQQAPKAVAVLADPVFDSDDERLKEAKAVPGQASVARAELDAPGPVSSSRARGTLRSFDEGDGQGLARLPFSRREARAIMEVVPEGEGLLALDFRASRATVMGGALADYRIVHFATHGILNSTRPELSGIVLSLYDETGRSQDGFLGLSEIYNLDLQADLVVLSACETALGKEIRGEGLVGLTRGFMYAGSPRVIASLWKVDDAVTARLMAQFYKVMLVQGRPPAAALRAAQVQMWQQGQWSSPYYWAAFTLQGEWK